MLNIMLLNLLAILEFLAIVQVKEKIVIHEEITS